MAGVTYIAVVMDNLIPSRKQVYGEILECTNPLNWKLVLGVTVNYLNSAIVSVNKANLRGLFDLAS